MDSRTLLLLATVTACWLISDSNAIDNGDEMQRIFGGTEAGEKQFPFMVVLLLNGRTICSASIIAPKYVLTAAHCVVHDGITTEAGALSVLRNRSSEASEMKFEVAEVYPHEDYNEIAIENDIAILKLATEIVWSDRATNIAIASKTTSESNRFFTRSNICAAGWGSISPFVYLPVYLKNLRYAYQRITRCGFSRVNPEKQICATGAFPDLLSSTCSGDSGGPLFAGCRGGPFIQMGVTSYGTAFCVEPPILPSTSVYTNVTWYVDWIKNKTENTVTIA